MAMSTRQDVAPAVAIVAAYLAAAAALALAPLVMPPTYSWIQHTTSESAAQGLDGAWVARTGFLLFGFAVLATVLVARSWSRAARLAHATFGVCVIAAATYSSRPADPAAPFAAAEDTMHSVAATAMGFAFAFGVLLVAIRRTHRSRSLIATDAPRDGSPA